jgi:hypothetical protein
MKGGKNYQAGTTTVFDITKMMVGGGGGGGFT